MINRIRALFAGDDSGQPPQDPDKRLAAAVLLVESACADGAFDDDERATVAEILRRQFELSDEETATLLAEAVREQSNANHLVRFTRRIKETVPIEERGELIELLWEVAYADGIVHAYESNLLRRLAGLLYVSDRESGEARKRVLARLGID